MTVYLDTLVIINTYLGWLMILLVKRFLHLKSIPSRILAGALVSGLSSLTILITADSVVLLIATVIIKSFAVVSVPLIVFYKNGMGAKKCLIAVVYYLFVNIMFGGIVYLYSSVTGSRMVYINNAAFYFDVSLADIIIIAAIIYIVMIVVSHFIVKKNLFNASYSVIIKTDCETITLEGIPDTGNSVCDLFSGKPVIICTGFEKELPNNAKITAVPYSTINGEGILYAFKPDYLVIEDDKGKRISPDALISFKRDGIKRAVFNPAILE